MAGRSRIEWTEASWNPVTGCTKASPGCLHCYAERMAKRLQAMGQPNYREGFRVVLHPAVLNAPLNWTRSQLIFVISMSDLFHEDVPFDFIRKVFAVMSRARQHSFQVLTKRSERLEALAKRLPWPSSVLDWRKCRECRLRLPHRPPAPRPRQHAVRVVRAAACERRKS
jgi:protein gp37